MFDASTIKLNVKILQKAMIFNDSGKILTIKRSSTDFARPYTWDFPGGWLARGSSPDDSMRTKIFNETGLRTKKMKLFYYTHLYDKRKDEYTFFFCYKCKETCGKIKLSNEHSDHKWVTKEEFLKLKSVDYLVEFVSKIS